MQSVGPILLALARRRNHLGSFSYLRSADWAGKPREAEVGAREGPCLEDCDDRQEEHESGAGVDIPAGHGPPLPAQPPGYARAGDGVDERPHEEPEERASRDDDRENELVAQLDELEQEEEVPVGPGNRDGARVGGLLEL